MYFAEICFQARSVRAGGADQLQPTHKSGIGPINTNVFTGETDFDKLSQGRIFF